VRTGIWKGPVQGRRRVTRLNVEGDGQGDRDGHGGEQRAVFVYQISSYQYWQEQMNRVDLVYGQFGENFTVAGLADDEVCIGDHYRIGTALFEVTQPRVTCYRIGIRMDHPGMASLLTASGRPGFYFRLLEEGRVGAGDRIELVSKGPQRMTVAEVNALLYSSHHPSEGLKRALQISALSPGWRQSFETLAKAQHEQPGAAGNPALAPTMTANPAKPGFHPVRTTRISRECEGVLSFEMQPSNDKPLTKPLPGQYIVLRLRPKRDGPPLLRSYSLSGPLSSAGYRITVKIEPNGAAGTFLSDGVHQGDIVEVSEPRGVFTLHPGEGPVVLLSAGIGVTPVLAMLYDLATSGTSRQVWWLYVTRNGQSRAFAAEVRQLLGSIVHGRTRTWFTQPSAQDLEGVDYDASGRPSIEAFSALDVPREADFYICGPASFIHDLTASLVAWGTPSEQIHSELFGAGPSLTPGVIGGQAGAPRRPSGNPGTGPTVSFARSGLTVGWRESDQSLLELAEACGVPVRWSCRSGVCHNCESGLVSGSVTYEPTPLDAPADGNVLICCARPREDVVLDL
jgi:MOSC domain-containing protein YiiM/ferredoxin-NADP reductase